MDAIVLHGVKTHNLKNFDLILPHKKFYVVTGVSGSGKSSLSFDTLYAEGQRRYVESLSAYARQFLERMEKPDVESVTGVPPALAIEAKNTINNARSTVGTQTEINDYLRVLFARVGKTVCPDCGKEVHRSTPASIADTLIRENEGEDAAVLFKVTFGKKSKKYFREAIAELSRQGFVEFLVSNRWFSAEELSASKKDPPTELYVSTDRLKIKKARRKRLLDSIELAGRNGKGEIAVFRNGKMTIFSEDLRCTDCGRTFREPVPNLFSFNSPLGACPECQGFGRVITIDWDLVIPDKGRSIQEGAIEPWTKPSAAWEQDQLFKFCKKAKIPLSKPWNRLSKSHQNIILFGTNGKDDFFSVQDFFNYLEKKTYKMHVRILLSKYRGYVKCPQCKGTRLKPEALAVRIDGRNVYDVQELSIDSLLDFLEGLKFSSDESERVEPVYQEIHKRVRFLKEVGLTYLSLSRLSRTLSGGEVQRINLASSLGSALVDTLYVLDEPSIGLHERDNYLLIRLLKELRDLGNTVVVVEHDRAMMEAADELIDLGPLGGEKGGEVLYQGSVSGLQKAKASLTADYLSGRKRIERRGAPPLPKKNEYITIEGASEHNLKNINVQIPLHQMTVITGVSGSGKSTLIYDTLYGHYLRYKGQPVQDLGDVKRVKGYEKIDQMVLIDQSPIGRTPRSNPVTYMKAFDDIRKIFAAVPEAKRRGLTAGNFSFNVDGGRCPTCKGDGRMKVEMHFLADVFIPCEVCHATRYKSEILEIRYHGKNIHEVLSLTIDESIEFFKDQPGLHARLILLQRVGLGYLRLGQSATTLSGGEAQRLKLAVEMIEKRANHILYLFDEPTTGLHYHDIHFLMGALDELLEKGHSLVIIEHNMEIIRSADTVIDLGPEGGFAGGEVVYSGTTAGLMKESKSHTGRHLKKYLKSTPKSVQTTV